MINPVYDVDGIQIYHGDCREILPYLPKVDLVLTDIPFNVNLNYASYKDNLSDSDYRDLCIEWFRCFKMVSGSFIVKSPTKTMPIVLPCFAQELGYVWTVIQHSP
jgi:DNA modification methylase